MNPMTIPQMNRKLQQLNRFFSEKSTQFCILINNHEGKLTSNDQNDFYLLVQKLKDYVNSEIYQFFNRKIYDKCSIYDSQITNFTQSGQNTKEGLDQFRQGLKQSTVQLKEAQNRKENLLEHFSIKYNRNTILKRYWKILNYNKEYSKRQTALHIKMKQLYHQNLLKKSFLPWRTLTYKQGYENTVKKQTESDIMNIHQQYQSIINILKNKISETDDIIKIKKAAKGEFAYALNKNLLKTISNLSLEVMSLNQISLRQDEVSVDQSKKFMKQLDIIIQDKLKKVREYKNHLHQSIDQSGERKKKKITFIQS